MNVGGPSIQVTGLMQDLDPALFEQRLLVGYCGDDEEDYLELHQLDLGAVRVPGLGRAIRLRDDARAFRRVRDEIRAFRPDIVHTHMTKAGVLGRLAALLARLRPRPLLVHTFHGHLLGGYFRPTTARGVVYVERSLARRTDRLVAVGDRVRDELIRAGVGRPEQYTVTAPGVAIRSELTAAEARAALGVGCVDPIVAYVGRLTGIKRPDRLVDVARRVVSRVPEAVFVVVGDGDLLEDTRQQARELGESVRFLGVRPDVADVLVAADVVLLTSDNEGTPVSLIEAGMMGCPAVTTRVGSAGEVVLDGRTGLVVERRSDALAEAVLHLLSHRELRERMGSEARVHTRRHFSRARLVTDTADMYGDLVASRGSQ